MVLQYKLFLVNNLHTGEVAARQDSFSGATSLNKAQQSILFTSLSHNERQALVLRGQPAIFQKPLGFMSNKNAYWVDKGPLSGTGLKRTKKAVIKRLKLAFGVGLKLTEKLKKFSLCRKNSDSKSLSPLIKVSQTNSNIILEVKATQSTAASES